MSNAAIKLLILGSRVFAEEVADLVEETPGFELAGFVENVDPERCKDRLLGKPVHWVSRLAAVDRSHRLLCGIGTTKRRRFVDEVAAWGLPFATLVHPSARVSRTSMVGQGSILSVNAIVAAHTTLGRHTIVNRAATIGHHTEIGEYVTIAPGATIAGKCVIEPGCYIAAGAIVIDRVRIGASSIVGAGAVVTKDVPSNVQVVGVPARIVKEGIDGR